jgi:hypothetical protein
MWQLPACACALALLLAAYAMLAVHALLIAYITWAQMHACMRSRHSVLHLQRSNKGHSRGHTHTQSTAHAVRCKRFTGKPSSSSSTVQLEEQVDPGTGGALCWSFNGLLFVQQRSSRLRLTLNHSCLLFKCLV